MLRASEGLAAGESGGSVDLRSVYGSNTDPGAGVLHDYILSRCESGDLLRIETWNWTKHIPASSLHTSVFML